ncbi:insulinase family protein [Bacillus sp. HMF5848]|uniref:EF-P 5-aminopentanol modification-associated protein YfmF n=1 Tax=Bacillus sp. HMF5848 TaxID=2495421 RepID=UPI000F7B6EC7|nr:pitrilysin family protein [Bacillus sp. HMF5848]RSK27093.1 insulinase family protein [Bacillus sp. HMF5848]
MLIEHKKQQIQGLQVHVVPTKKFKTTTIILKLNAPLQQDTVTLRALLPHVLQNATSRFTSTSKLRSYLDDLYGAHLFVDLAKKGENHVITFTLEVANEKYLQDSTPLFEKAAEFFSELIHHPLLENNKFNQDVLRKEKRAMEQRIQAVYDDKMRYANLRLVQEMCKNEPYKLHVNGEIDDVNNITSESLFNYYQKSTDNDKADLYVVGDIEEKVVVDTVSKYFSFSQRDNTRTTMSHCVEVVDQKEIKEEQDVKQGKLNMGYRTNITYADDLYYSLQVFNGVFGGFSHSKLFRNVREKESLAYYAASRVESHKGLLMVMSGIDSSNYNKAVTIINEQLDAIKNGSFTDEEILQTKAVLRNQILETVDTARGIVEVLYHNELSLVDRPLNNWLKGVEAVSKDDIINAANLVQLDTIYFLTGKEGGQ